MTRIFLSDFIHPKIFSLVVPTFRIENVLFARKPTFLVGKVIYHRKNIASLNERSSFSTEKAWLSVAFSKLLKGLFHLTFIVRVVSWLAFGFRHFHDP